MSPFAILVQFAMLVTLALAQPGTGTAADLPRTIAAVKPSIVGVGTYQRTRTPAIRFASTGFAVGDGLSIITNAHSIPALLDSEKMEVLGVVVKNGKDIAFRPATLAGMDREHDLAHLRLSGPPLAPLTLGDSAKAVEGMDFAFTGFPLAMALGMHHATHRATLASITPVAMPALNSSNLNPRVLSQLQKTPFAIFQLDATAYPGNSGSPLYDPETGVVFGILNMVMVKGLKETAITAPSGITYAIPASYIQDLLKQEKR